MINICSFSGLWRLIWNKIFTLIKKYKKLYEVRYIIIIFWLTHVRDYSRHFLCPYTAKILNLGLSFEACVCYFSLFLKEQYVSWLRNTLKWNLTYSCFIFLMFHKHLFSPELPHAARLLKSSCFEKITVCAIERMLVT